MGWVDNFGGNLIDVMLSYVGSKLFVCVVKKLVREQMCFQECMSNIVYQWFVVDFEVVGLNCILVFGSLVSMLVGVVGIVFDYGVVFGDIFVKGSVMVIEKLQC